MKFLLIFVAAETRPRLAMNSLKKGRSCGRTDHGEAQLCLSLQRARITGSADVLVRKRDAVAQIFFASLSADEDVRAPSTLLQIFIEPIERASPREFGGGFVVARSCVVMEAVLFSFVHMLLKDFVIRL